MKNKRKKKIIFTIILTFIISIVAYGWFSINNRADVNNLAISAGTEGNLLIAEATNNGPGTYGNKINLSAGDDVVLNPVTTIEGREFYSPIYSGEDVVSVKKITNNTELTNGYIYEKQFYLKVENEGRGNNGNYYIYLVANAGNNGTYVKDAENTSGDTAANSVRVSFTIDNETVVYEPNADGNNISSEMAGDRVSNTYNSYATEKQNRQGVFTNSSNGNDSNYLFDIEADRDKLVTMRIWIEGKDKDCANSIELDDLLAQFQFSSISIKNSNAN